MTPVEQRDPNAIYHRKSPAELARLAPGFPWRSYFAAVGLTPPGTSTSASPSSSRKSG